MSVTLAIFSSEAIENESLYQFVLDNGGYKHDQDVFAHLSKGVAHISIVRDNSVANTMLEDCPAEYQRITKELGSEPHTSIVIEIGGREAEKNSMLAFEFVRLCMEKWHCILTTLSEEFVVLTKQDIQKMYEMGERTLYALS